MQKRTQATRGSNGGDTKSILSATQGSKGFEYPKLEFSSSIMSFVSPVSQIFTPQTEAYKTVALSNLSLLHHCRNARY